MSSIELPKRLTIAETAAELDVHRATVERDIASGRLGCYRLGPRGKIIRVGEHHLRDYLTLCETRMHSASAPTSSASVPIAGCGAPAGTTNVLDRQTAVAS